MAATDKPYRNQYRLDVIFGVSCILLLASVGWMMYDDHYRPFKKVQRQFRDVEEALYVQQMVEKYPQDRLDAVEAQQQAVNEAKERLEAARADSKRLQQVLGSSPDGGGADLQRSLAEMEKEKEQKEKDYAEKKKQYESAEDDQEKKKAADELKKAKAELDAKRAPIAAAINKWVAQKALEKARLEAQYQDAKANYDSQVSLYNIAVDERDTAPDGSHKKKLAEEVEAKKALLKKMDEELQGLQRRLTENEKATAAALADQKAAEDQLAADEDKLRKMTNDFDRLAKLAAQKRWKTGDWFRALPIIDGFASPYRIQQVTLNDLTIDYGGFRDVPRYDRCTTCHQGIDRASFDPASLRRLDLADKKDDSEEEKAAKQERRDELKKRHAAALAFLKKRANDRGEKLGFDPDDLRTDVPSVSLTDAQVKMYSAHPRLELFVDSNSPHPLEKFGCTACHGGQGSATEFYFAVHTPNDAAQRRQWQKEHDWEFFRDWEFPMLPARFVESGCVKCHHQMTDLIRQGSKEEAPKLLKGYNLVKDNGCFGCHEISGLKSGKEVGPDLRLEPAPALDQLSAEERAKVLADPGNPPGTLRKVGPSLRRISEKTNEEWARKWINLPRGFRPDTRMPHFYNLSNNSPDVLPDDKDNPDKNQKDFPATEIASIAHYLFTESRAYLNGSDRFRQFNQDRLKYLEDFERRNLLSDNQRKELIEVRRRLDQWKVPTPIIDKDDKVHIVDADGKVIPPDQIPKPPKDQDREKDLAEGRRLFTERGCLACHSHAGTETGAQPVTGDAHFGPNLSRLAAKVSGDNGRRWLIQWVINPNVYHPRTRMPITHLDAKQAGQVADWLLSQKQFEGDKDYQDWKAKDPGAPSKEKLVNLARVYLRKAPAVNPLKVDEVLEKGFTDIKTEAPLMTDDADEQVLKGEITADKLKKYIGKKAISRQGCFACHDIPGFEFAKPVGTPLNDWGKKDPARLAFEDISAYVKDHYDVVDLRNDSLDPAKPSEEWAGAVGQGKRPYERFFADALNAHLREGFLHQKLEEPRSYDYHRDLRWEDRLRMPQFKFAHPKPNKGESKDDFAARAAMEEAEAREAVMTFILGLVAEPIHARYLNNPDPDHLAEVKGRQVLDKFNCGGCHQVRAGVFDVKLNDDSRAALEATYKTLQKSNFTDDHVFAFHNAWVGSQNPNADRLTLHGVDPRELNLKRPSGQPVLGADGRPLLGIRLTDAVQFLGRDGKVLTLRGGNVAGLDRTTITSRSDPFGGTFAHLLTPYLIAKNSAKYPDEKTASSALPPPLVREGERVQPDWMFGFLRNPTEVRPMTVLRMPKFNMSEDEAHDLVNYFAAADKVSNPGIGLVYPYTTVPERKDVYWRDQARKYWEATDKEKGLETRVTDLEKVTKAETNKERKAALEAKLSALKDFAKKPDEAAASLYWADAYSLMATKNLSICLDCHRVGDVSAKEDKGPPLELAFNRLRPGWTEWWIANPDRLLTYPTPMPQNFENGQRKFQELMPGQSLEQVGALRDVLMNFPRVADLPVNRSYRAATSGGK
jgi:mono/diheme cytochrome c family protein